MGYPEEDDVILMIFGGTLAQPSKRQEKLIQREIYNTELVTPSYLKWSETPITFDRANHLDHVPQTGSYPLVMAPLFGTKRIHKVPMDGGSSVNVLYVSTLGSMGISRSRLRPLPTPFHGVVREMEALPLG